MTRTERLKLNDLPRWVHVSAIVSCLLITLLCIVAFVQYRDINIWTAFDAYTETEPREVKLSGKSYTERVYPNSIFRTRANTWSNLAYVYVGIYAIVLGLYDWRRRWPIARGYVPHFPAYSVAFGIACCYLGFGSGVFHASLTRWGQQLDVAGMYPPMLVLIAAHIGRRLPYIPGTRYPSWPILLSGVAAIAAYLYVYKWEMSSFKVLATLILTLGAFSVLDVFWKASHTQSRWMIYSFAALVIAVFFRQIDVARKFTGPDAWLQGHFIWHCMTAASQGLLYLYFRTEEREAVAP